ncbi:MAG: hypothetical protein LBT37_01245 [Lactobacillaceae bacterium]|jgi:hypothetical protein|nr:hypothetical protein [Lactobacillaceae bacterium]
MTKYVLHAPSHQIITSGKVREDIVTIAHEIGYQKMEVTDVLNNEFYSGDIVLYPFPSDRGTEEIDYERILHLKKQGVKISVITLNVDYLRYHEANREIIIKSLNTADVMLTLTIPMMNALHADGVVTDALIVGLHDYLVPKPQKPAEFKREVVVAGSPYKASYIQNWPNQTPLHIYARESDMQGYELKGNVNYLGYINPNEINEQDHFGFGLAFDMDSQAGEFDAYQEINLSHKLSMYLAAGMPILIKSSAAASTIITTFGAGIKIDSVDEIDEVMANITPEQYAKMAENANTLGEFIRQGAYYKYAITLGEEQIDAFERFKNDW